MKLLVSMLAAAAAVAGVAAESSALRGLQECPTGVKHPVVLRLDDVQDNQLSHVHLTLFARLRARRIRFSATLNGDLVGNNTDLVDALKANHEDKLVELSQGAQGAWGNMTYPEACDSMFKNQMHLFNVFGAWPQTFVPFGGAYSLDVKYAMYKFGMKGISSDEDECMAMDMSEEDRRRLQEDNDSDTENDNDNGEEDNDSDAENDNDNGEEDNDSDNGDANGDGNGNGANGGNGNGANGGNGNGTRNNQTICLKHEPVWKAPSHVMTKDLRSVDVSIMLEKIDVSIKAMGFAVVSVHPRDLVTSDDRIDPQVLAKWDELVLALSQGCYDLESLEDLKHVPRVEEPHPGLPDEQVEEKRDEVEQPVHPTDNTDGVVDEEEPDTVVDEGEDQDVDGNVDEDEDLRIIVVDDADSEEALDLLGYEDVVLDEQNDADSAAGAALAGAATVAAMGAVFAAA